MVETPKLGWIAECTMHHWLRFFGDNKAAAEKAWREHVKEHPTGGCEVTGPGVKEEEVG